MTCPSRAVTGAPHYAATPPARGAGTTIGRGTLEPLHIREQGLCYLAKHAFPLNMVCSVLY